MLSGGLKREEILNELLILKNQSMPQIGVFTNLERVCSSLHGKVSIIANQIKDMILYTYYDFIIPGLPLSDRLDSFTLNWKTVSSLLKQLLHNCSK